MTPANLRAQGVDHEEDGRLPAADATVTASPVLRTEPASQSQPSGRVPHGAGDLLQLIAELSHPKTGILRGIYASDPDAKLLRIKVGELRKVANLCSVALATLGEGKRP